MKHLIQSAFDRRCVLRSIKIVLVVGTLLAFINHYDAIVEGDLTQETIVQILLTYLVPYVVATLGSVLQERESN